MTQGYWEMLGAVSAAITTTVIGPTIFEFIKSKFIKPKKEPDSVRENIKGNLIIDENLLLIRERIECDRIWIIQFHNGGHFLQFKKSIQKISTTHENTKPGVSSVMFLLKEIPISLYTKTLHEILENGSLSVKDFDNEELPYYGLKGLTETTGTKATFIVGLFDIETNRCIGLLGVDFLEPKVLNHANRDFVIERASRLAGYLSSYLNSPN